jgi:surface antigen
LKEFTAFVGTTLDAAPDGATVEWNAPKSVFTGKITPVRTFTDGKLPCREARIETEARDRHASGNYVLCKVKGVWQLKVPDQK